MPAELSQHILCYRRFASTGAPKKSLRRKPQRDGRHSDTNMSSIDRSTVMFARLAGSAELTQGMGPEMAHERLVKCQARLEELINEYNGELVDVIGDETLSLFASPDAALNASCRMQSVVNLGEDRVSDGLSLRIGMHLGVVYRQDDNIFGDTVNTASRVVNICTDGQILTTQQTVDEMHAQSKELLRLYDRVRVKGKRDDLKIYEGIWQPEDLNQTSIHSEMIDSGYLKSLTADKLILRVGEERFVLTPGTTPVVVGRGNHCDINVMSPAASRNHGRIDHRRGKFILIDESSNGTHIVRADGSQAVLKREEAVLTGSGIISLGQMVGDDNDFVVSYECT